MCVSKKDLAFYPEMRRRRGEARLVKLGNSTISMGKKCAVGAGAVPHCSCVCGHLHPLYLLPVRESVCVCVCVCVFCFQVFGLYLHEVKVPRFLTLVRRAHKKSQWEVDVIHQTAAGLFVTPLTKERLNGQMNSVSGVFYSKVVRIIELKTDLLTCINAWIQTQLSSCLVLMCPVSPVLGQRKHLSSY